MWLVATQVQGQAFAVFAAVTASRHVSNLDAANCLSASSGTLVDDRARRGTDLVRSAILFELNR